MGSSCSGGRKGLDKTPGPRSGRPSDHYHIITACTCMCVCVLPASITESACAYSPPNSLIWTWTVCNHTPYLI